MFFLFFFFRLTNSDVQQVKLPQAYKGQHDIAKRCKINIWGWAAKGEKVNDEVQGKNYKTTTGADGKWSVLLPPMKAGGPYTMDISGKQ